MARRGGASLFCWRGQVRPLASEAAAGPPGLAQHPGLPDLWMAGADGVLQEFVQKQRGRVDQGIWNAFITAAGRAAQLQRAVQALGDMQVRLHSLASGLAPVAEGCLWTEQRSPCAGKGREAR